MCFVIDTWKTNRRQRPGLPEKSYTARVTGAWGGQEDRRKRVQDLESCLKEKSDPGCRAHLGGGKVQKKQSSWTVYNGWGEGALCDSDRGRVSQRAVGSPQKTGRESESS